MRGTNRASSLIEELELRRLLASITVTTVSDDLSPNDGSVSLREAITAIDAGSDLGDPNITSQNPGAFGTADSIHFDIPGTGLHGISLSSALPTITKPVVIDGFTQPGASANTLAVGDNAVREIEIDGPTTENAINIDSGNVTVRGLKVSNFEGTAIDVPTSSHFKTDLTFVGDEIAGSGTGINVDPTSTTDSVTVGGTDPADRNLFDFNGGHDLVIGANFSKVQGNYFGVTPSGLKADTNGSSSAISIPTGVQGVLIGGEESGARNIIVANLDGIEINGNANTVQGNYIGLDANGENGLASGFDGIFSTGGNTIGGSKLEDRNLIGGWQFGIVSGGDDVEGNYIGTDVTGTVAVPNQTGILRNAGGLTPIGGTAPGAGNLISGNHGAGIIVDSGLTFNAFSILGNLIGTDVTGTKPLPNGGDGVLVQGVNALRIGDGTAAGSNTIAYNGHNGVTATDNSTINPGDPAVHVVGNSIYSNVLLGIDLNDDSVTPNDTNDADSGPNNLQNFPVLSAAASDANHTIINGSLNTASATDPYAIDFYASPSADSSGFGEGKTFIGEILVNVGASNNATFSADFPVAVAPGAVITATASGQSFYTSEFSHAIATAPLVTPQISINDVSKNEGNSGPTAFTFTISMDSSSNIPVTVNYATADVTAQAGSDYVAQDFSVLFNPGQTSKQVTINVVGDTNVEADELFAVNLSGATNAVIADSQGIGTIINDDAASPPPPLPTLSIDNVTHHEGNSGTTDFTFTIARSGDLTGSSSIAVGTADGTATVADNDYSPGGTVLNFASGESSKTFTVKVNGDTKVESDETFLVDLTGATGATITTSQGTGTIQNDDVPPPPSGHISLITDPCNSSKKALAIDGTSNSDSIIVSYAGAQGKAKVTINGVNKGTFSFSGSILISGEGGNDNISVSSSITRSAWIWGGSGKDTVSAGGGNDVIFGYGGSDSLKGNAGRDILVGGDGTDKLNGGSGDDLLLGGDFKSAPTMSQLCSIQKEWTRTDKSYSYRVSHLKNGGGYNTIKLNSSTLYSSPTLKDSLTGGSNNDVFFAAVPGDVITDKASGETVVDIG